MKLSLLTTDSSIRSLSSATGLQGLSAPGASAKPPYCYKPSKQTGAKAKMCSTLVPTTFILKAQHFMSLLSPFIYMKAFAPFTSTKFINMRTGGVSTKSIKNILLSNLEVFSVFKLYNIRYKYYYIVLKILRKIKQIKLPN